MCLEIQYTYPSCTHLVKIGKYACYHARHHQHASPSPGPPPSSPSALLDTPCPIRTPHIADFYSSPRLTYNEDLQDFPSPLRLEIKKEKPVTIKTLLSRRHEDTSRVGRCAVQFFDLDCEFYGIYQQPLRTGERCCYRCALQERRRERVDDETLLGAEDGEEMMGRPKSRGRTDSIRLVMDDSDLEGEGTLEADVGMRMSPRNIVDEVERDTEAVRRAREAAKREAENAREDLKGVEIEIGSGDVDMDFEVENVEHT